MNRHESDFDCPQLPDAAAYALGSLEDDEAARFLEHLDSCAQCRAELAELQPVVDELPLKLARERAPEALRERILAQVRAESELLHAAGHSADETPRRSWWHGLASPVGAAVAVAAAVAIALVVVLSSGSGGGEKIFPGRTSVPGASASLRQHDGRSELVVARMPQPGPGRIYEVWLSRGPGNAEPTNALFGVTSKGDGETAVPSDLHGIREVMVTSEPAGGSPQPTRSPLIQVALPS
jgi:anti-sigma-K factor RskA